MIIRKANLEDIPTIVDTWVEFQEEHDEIVIRENPRLEPYEVKEESAPDKYRDFLQTHIESSDGEVLLAEVDGVIAGYSLIFIKDEIPIFKTKKMGYISDLYVRQEFRGKGISSRLKDEAIRWFKEKGMRYVSIIMYPDNKPAHTIYKKWGFFDFKADMRMELDTESAETE